MELNAGQELCEESHDIKDKKYKGYFKDICVEFNEYL